MKKLLLFDVDQTILSTGGGDRKALNIAFEEMYGIRDGFQEIEFAGRMDLSIVGDAFRKWGVDGADDPEAMYRFRDAYVEVLEEVLKEWSKGREYPGVRDLLERLAGREDVGLGLATGNFRESALVKLRRFGLDGFFIEGGFGGDSTNRGEVVALAIQRCQAALGTVYPKENVYVIGDSPRDIQAGRDNGVMTVAVATGYSTQEQLLQCGPTHLFPDLSDTERFLAQVLGPKA
ncbi:MAG: HAD family hydrolase [Dehalococcoidia bacterium]